MDGTQNTSDEQAALWNGVVGRAWVENQDLLEQMFEPFADLLVQSVSSRSANRVLDVGCGTGGTTLAVARRLGAKGRCTGVDISEPMIAAARARAGRDGLSATFICANAQTHAFDPASFDTIISRFGVMFFDDFVEAFSNLRHAASDDAALSVIVWRGGAENPFMTTAERAAAPLLPNLPERQPGAPGQFAFADPTRVSGILEASGWTDVEIRPIDAVCRFPESELVRFLSRIGPVGRILHEVEEPTRTRVIETVRAAFERYVHGAEVRFDAACWLVGAAAMDLR